MLDKLGGQLPLLLYHAGRLGMPSALFVVLNVVCGSSDALPNGSGGRAPIKLCNLEPPPPVAALIEKWHVIATML